LARPPRRKPAPIADCVRDILSGLGEDPDREGLQKTPERVEKALRFLTRGYEQDPVEILNQALFTVSYDEMVVVKDVDVYSLCEHHLLPFHGVAHIGYLPGERIVGLSKLGRVVDLYARRPQVQERLTTQVARWLTETLEPRGVGVVIQAEHLCMSLRGVQKPGARTMTSALHGLVRDDPRTRQEFLTLTGGHA
jgi:GTP cyclohydrolase IA